MAQVLDATAPTTDWMQYIDLFVTVFFHFIQNYSIFSNWCSHQDCYVILWIENRNYNKDFKFLQFNCQHLQTLYYIISCIGGLWKFLRHKSDVILKSYVCYKLKFVVNHLLWPAQFYWTAYEYKFCRYTVLHME